MHPARLALVACAAALAFGAVAATSEGRSSAQPPLTKAAAARASRLVQSAIEAEHEAAHLIGSEPDTARLHLSISALGLSAAFALIEPTSADAAAEALGNVAASDARAINLLKSDPLTKKERREALADIALAIKQKHVALEKIAAAVKPPPPAPAPTPPPPPALGPLGACVFITNNGSTSTEDVKVSDPGGAKLSGTVLFNGQGLNTTNQITLDGGGGAISPFTVGVFGTSSITVTVAGPGGQNQTLMFPFTLDAGSDVTTTDCTTHQ